jgi:hypothetical protein
LTRASNGDKCPLLALFGGTLQIRGVIVNVSFVRIQAN